MRNVPRLAKLAPPIIKLVEYIPVLVRTKTNVDKIAILYYATCYWTGSPTAGILSWNEGWRVGCRPIRFSVQFTVAINVCY